MSNPVERQNRRSGVKQIDDDVPLQPTAVNEPVCNEFELRILFLRLTAKGPVADHLANSVGHVAKAIAICLLVLSVAISLNLVFTSWSAWNIPILNHLPFSIEKKKEQAAGTRPPKSAMASF